MEMTMLLKLIQKLEHICMFFLRHGGIQILALFIVGELFKSRRYLTGKEPGN